MAFGIRPFGSGGSGGNYVRPVGGAGPSALEWAQNGNWGLAGVDSANAAKGQIGSAQANAQGQIGSAQANAQGQIGSAQAHARGQTNAAANQSLGQMGQSRYGAIGQIGSAGLNAMGQYGSAVAGSLANQSIAAGNTFGQMANNYYNTLGQMGHIGAALSAAGLAAGSNAANAQMANNMGINVGGGFGVGGPGGPVAQGLLGGYGGRGGQSMSMQRGGGAEERQRMLGQGFDYLGAAMGHLNSPNNQAMALAGLAGDQFNQNRSATMDPRFMQSMNSMFSDATRPLSGASQTPATSQSPAQGQYRLGGSTSHWMGHGQPNRKEYAYNWIQPGTLSASDAESLRKSGGRVPSALKLTDY